MPVLLLLLLAGGWALPVQESAENDGSSSRKILGSSVVTSVSVVMDGADRTHFTDAVGKPVAKPLIGTQVASPINLLNPDRYEFYTFDDSGDLIKRLMTLEEIQGIIANGDGDMFNYNSPYNLPEKKVNDVVNNVQNVLKGEMELFKNESHVLDTPDVSSTWSMILPAVFSGDKTQSLTADTIMLEPEATEPPKTPIITVAIITNSEPNNENSQPTETVVNIKPTTKKPNVNTSFKYSTPKSFSTTGGLKATQSVSENTQAALKDNKPIKPSTYRPPFKPNTTRKPVISTTTGRIVQTTTTSRPIRSTTSKIVDESNKLDKPEVLLNGITQESNKPSNVNEASMVNDSPSKLPTNSDVNITSIEEPDKPLLVTSKKPTIQYDLLKTSTVAAKPSTTFVPTSIKLSITSDSTQKYSTFDDIKVPYPNNITTTEKVKIATSTISANPDNLVKITSASPSEYVNVPTTSKIPIRPSQAPPVLQSTRRPELEAPLIESIISVIDEKLSVSDVENSPVNSIKVPSTIIDDTKSSLMSLKHNESKLASDENNVQVSTISNVTKSTSGSTSNVIEGIISNNKVTDIKELTTQYNKIILQTKPDETKSTTEFNNNVEPPLKPDGTKPYNNNVAVDSELTNEFNNDVEAGTMPDGFSNDNVEAASKPDETTFVINNVEKPAETEQIKLTNGFTSNIVLSKPNETSGFNSNLEASSTTEEIKLSNEHNNNVGTFTSLKETTPPINSLSADKEDQLKPDKIVLSDELHDLISSTTENFVKSSTTNKPLLKSTTSSYIQLSSISNPIETSELSTIHTIPTFEITTSSNIDSNIKQTTYEQQVSSLNEEATSGVTDNTQDLIKISVVSNDALRTSTIADRILESSTILPMVSEGVVLNTSKRPIDYVEANKEINVSSSSEQPIDSDVPTKEIENALKSTTDTILKLTTALNVEKPSTVRPKVSSSTVFFVDHQTNARIPITTKEQLTTLLHLLPLESTTKIVGNSTEKTNLITNGAQSSTVPIDTTATHKIEENTFKYHVISTTHGLTVTKFDEEDHKDSSTKINNDLKNHPTTTAAPTATLPEKSVDIFTKGEETTEPLRTSLPNIIDQLLLSSTNIFEINTELSKIKLSGSSTESLLNQTNNSIKESNDLYQTSETSIENPDSFTTMSSENDDILLDSIGQLLQQAVGNSEDVVGASTVIPETTNTITVEDSDLLSESVGSLLSQVGGLDLAMLSTTTEVIERSTSFDESSTANKPEENTLLSQTEILPFNDNIDEEDVEKINDSATKESISNVPETSTIKEDSLASESIHSEPSKVNFLNHPANEKPLKNDQNKNSKVEVNIVDTSTSTESTEKESDVIKTSAELIKQDMKPIKISSQVSKPIENSFEATNESKNITLEDDKETTIIAIITRPTTIKYENKTHIITTTKLPILKPYVKKDDQDNWSLVPTIKPHSNLTYPQPKPEIKIPPVKPVELVPQPQQGFGLEDSTVNLEPDIYQFTALCNELAFGFWKTVTNGISTARSVFISPFAATSLLAMVFLGARGATSGEMNEILRLDDMVTFNPHLIFKNVTESIEVGKKSGVATSVILRELYSDRSKGQLLDFYKERARQFYDGYVEEVSFREVGDVIRRRTNLIVKRKTHGKILEYVKDASLSVKPPLAGVSVTIFQTDCSEASTDGRDGELYFIVLPTIRQRRLVPIPAAVWKSGFLAGYEPGLDATAVSIGSKDNTISTIFVIPGQQGIAAPGDGLARLEKHLVNSAFKDNSWGSLLRSLIPRPGLEVQIPRFSHRSVLNASVALQYMGMKDLFDSEKADLRGLNGVANDLYLSDMIQLNSFATCGENQIGDSHHSEIYPATANRTYRRSRKFQQGFDEFLEEPRDYQRAFHDPLHDPTLYALPLPLRPRQARLPDNPRLRFDRPFLYFVRHNPTGLILHMGRFNPRLLP